MYNELKTAESLLLAGSQRPTDPETQGTAGWPALLSPRKSASSTPIHTRKQPWTAAKGRTTNNPPKPPSVPIQNRYVPLTEDRDLVLMTGITCPLHTAG